MTIFNRVLLVAAFASLAPFAAQADSWNCTHGKQLREVHVERPLDADTPCDVVYKKTTEGADDQVLWNAQNDGSYCDAKAKAFVEKLEGWGWNCSAMN